MTAFVHGLTQENAKALLALAEEQGLDPGVVTTTEDGFNVPDSIYDAYTKSDDDEGDDQQDDDTPAEADKPKPARRKRPAQDKESAG